MARAALITGASGGLGEEFAKLFAADGYDVILVARGEEKLRALAAELEKTHGIAAHSVPADLSTESGVNAVIAFVREKNVDVSVLVNNAGFGAYGPFYQTEFAQEMSLLAVNIVALTTLTKAFLPAMVARKEGAILNVASTAAFQPGPLMAVYYASKAYVLSFSEAIRLELEGTGVCVTCLCPGPTKTGFQDHAGMKSSRLFRGHVADARSVALAGYRGLQCGKGTVIPGISHRFFAFLTRLVPRSVAGRVARKLQERV